MDQRFAYSPADLAKVKYVQFGIMSPEEIRQMSVVKIESSETYDRGKPKLGGLSDPRLGTIDRQMKCETCAGNMSECPGAFRSFGAGKANVPYWVFENYFVDLAMCVL